MNTLRCCLGLLAGLAVVAPVAADEARGRIVQIDPDRKMIRLETRGPLRGAVLELKLDDKTQILVGGQPATLDDLAPGRRIRVVFEPRGGRPVAQVIRSLGLLGGPPRAPATPPGAPALKEGEGVAGTLQRISLADREVVVLGPGAKGAHTETRVAVPEETAIRRDGKKITLDDLKEGETATVRTESRKGQLTATSIDTGRAAATAEAPAMPPRRNLIPRLRQALQLADELLREMEEQKGGNPNRP